MQLPFGETGFCGSWSNRRRGLITVRMFGWSSGPLQSKQGLCCTFEDTTAFLACFLWYLPFFQPWLRQGPETNTRWLFISVRFTLLESDTNLLPPSSPEMAQFDNQKALSADPELPFSRTNKLKEWGESSKWASKEDDWTWNSGCLKWFKCHVLYHDIN